MQNEITPAEDNNSAQLEAESALRDAACSSFLPSWVSETCPINWRRPRFTPPNREYGNTPWLELSEHGSLYMASEGGGFLSLVGRNRTEEVERKLKSGEWVMWEYVPYNFFKVLWEMIRHGHSRRWRRVVLTNS